MEKDNKPSLTPRIDRMVLNYGPPPKKRREEGDKKMIRGVMHICIHVQTHEGFYLMSRGKPVLEWQPLEEYRAERGLSSKPSPSV